jgi:enoyl-CoA hydratase/carnithine racemase
MKMDLQTRKLEFIREFLKVGNEVVLAKLEEVLKNAGSSIESDLLTESELNARITRSEEDFREGRFKSQDQIEKKYRS